MSGPPRRGAIGKGGIRPAKRFPSGHFLRRAFHALSLSGEAPLALYDAGGSSKDRLPRFRVEATILVSCLFAGDAEALCEIIAGRNEARELRQARYLSIGRRFPDRSRGQSPVRPSKRGSCGPAFGQKIVAGNRPDLYENKKLKTSLTLREPKGERKANSHR